jgi:FtsH-binding integral membrane protein
MSLCTEVGRWITEHVETPVETFFENAREQCTETRRWVEREVRRPIEKWREQQQQQCREQKCNWLCLCCNKWVCTIVTVLVRVVEWIVEIVGEWLVETVCKLIVEIVRTIVMVLIAVTRWVVEAVVCFVEKLCEYLYFLIGVALIGILVGVVVSVGTIALPGGIAALLAGAAAAVVGLLLTRILCERDRCRLPRLLVWALKWAIVIGIVIAVLSLSILSGFIVVLYGGIVSALIWRLHDSGCPIPRLLGWP